MVFVIFIELSVVLPVILLGCVRSEMVFVIFIELSVASSVFFLLG